MLAGCRALLTSFGTDLYFTKKASTTVLTAMNLGVPIIADRRVLSAYSYLDPDAVLQYPPAVKNSDYLQGYKAAVREALQQEWQLRRQSMFRTKAKLMEHNKRVAETVTYAAML